MVYNQLSHLFLGTQMLNLDEAIKDDILAIQDMQGTNLIYEEHDDVLFAYQINDEGDVIAQYCVHIHLEKL